MSSHSKILATGVKYSLTNVKTKETGQEKRVINVDPATG